jgi:hypothetical protein
MVDTRRDGDPFPALGADRIGGGFEPLNYQPIENGRVGQLAFMVRLKQVTQDMPARSFVDFVADEGDAPVAGFDVRDHQVTADGGRALVPLRQRCPNLFLRRVIVIDRESHKLVEVVLPVGFHQARADIAELERKRGLIAVLRGLSWSGRYGLVATITRTFPEGPIT